MQVPTRDTVYRSFKNLLLDGTLKQGSFVTQRELCDLLHSSVGTVREALQRLETEELVKVQPQRGIWIAETNIRMINEAFQFRMILELDAVRRFAASFEPVEFEQLHERTAALLLRVRGSSPADGDSLIEDGFKVDTALHSMLIERMNNSMIEKTYSAMQDRLNLVRLNGNYTVRRLEKALDEHLAVLEAISRNDVEASAEALRAHLTISWRRALGGDEVGL